MIDKSNRVEARDRGPHSLANADRAAFKENGIAAGFLFHVDRLPKRSALTIGKRTWSYAEASDTARRWASRLIDAADGRPRRVGLFADRSETAYLGVLATLFAGGAFVPLNYKFPSERTRAMLERAEVDALFVDSECLPALLSVFRGLDRRPPILLPAADAHAVRGAMLSTTVFGRKELAGAAPLSSLPHVLPDDCAYLLFTSGSTGDPKGVPITHGNVRAFLDANRARYNFTPEDRFTQAFDQTFDLSVFDLFMPWECGATVCSMRKIELLAPFQFLRDNDITVWFSVPSAATLLINRGALHSGSMPSLRWSLFCGEGLSRATAETWQAAAQNSIVENLYGPTELTIACSAYRWDPERSPAECVHDLVPIGEVYPGLSAIVVDDELCEVVSGKPGELCVAGPQVSPGYWRAPELTAAKFFERTAPNGTAARYYRTGDIVARQGDAYVFLGREDHQIKIGGYRIELDEIEAVLRRAGCVDVAALAWPDAEHPESIVAAVTGVNEVAHVITYSRRYLPSYMIPREIQVVDAMPLNRNGKLDRDALYNLFLSQQVDGGAQTAAAGAGSRPASILEKQGSIMAAEPLIARALGIEVERVTDDLMYQSIPEWDSLGHVGLLIVLESEFGVRISDELAPKLNSVDAIRAFIESFSAGEGSASSPGSEHPPDVHATIHRGLEGVVVDRSSISHVDGKRGELLYRGYNLHDLAERSTFEETTWLLIHGELADPATLEAFSAELRAARSLPEPVLALIRSLANSHPVEVLRTGVSALGALEANTGTGDEPPASARRAGIRLIAQVPMLIAAHHAFRSGGDPVPPGPTLSHAENLLHMLLGAACSPSGTRLVDMDLIVHAEHSSNASAFAARVAIGAGASMHSAITSAIATFAGSIHGGAAERVIELIDAVGTPENAAAYVKALLATNQPVMGFGHRVYRTEDPRVRHLREAAMALGEERGDLRGYHIIEAVVEAMEPYSRHGVSPNVDLYAGLFYRLLGLPSDLSVPMFVAGRIAGWVAQAIEQKRENVLIRPLLHYVGPPARTFPR